MSKMVLVKLVHQTASNAVFSNHKAAILEAVQTVFTKPRASILVSDVSTDASCAQIPISASTVVITSIFTTKFVIPVVQIASHVIQPLIVPPAMLDIWSVLTVLARDFQFRIAYDTALICYACSVTKII